MFNPSPENHVMNSLHSIGCIQDRLDAVIHDFFRNCPTASLPETILYHGLICSRLIPHIQHSLSTRLSRESLPAGVFWICPLTQCPVPDTPCPPEFHDPAIDPDWLACLWSWSRNIGAAGAFFFIETGFSPVSPKHGLNTFLLTAAAVGLFQRSEPRQIVIDPENDSILWIGWFVNKPYRIRPARISDLPDQQRIEAALSRNDDDDIAVIGMACRFPTPSDNEDGDTQSGLATFWDVLVNGRNAVRPLSAERLALMDEPDPDRVPSSLKYGGQIPWADAFDASFFDISPREARCMDPQHRVLMETVWETLEHAAIDPGTLAGTRCGVFVGIFGHDYAGLQIRRQLPDDVDAYFGTGTSPSVAAGRISYFLGLNGPALTIDTASSSSLVAIHQACESIRSGESDLAIAGGVNLILATDVGKSFNRAGMLSADGCCRTFDAGANGYVRSDGCGVVVLKRLRRAVQDGDPIQAVIRASVINQDGFSNGLTAPRLDAQKSLIREALTRSKLQPQEVQYLETHGSGTPLGDAVEIQAIAAGYGREKIENPPLILGSVKTNIGHCEAAAGVAGLIKVILSLQHETIPRHLHFQQIGPLIELDDIPAVIASDRVPWPRKPDGPIRCGAVSSFGFSGTNAHVIIQEAPKPTISETPKTTAKTYLLTLSAKTPAALSALIRRYAAFLATAPDTDIADICHTAHVGRAHFSHRAAVVGNNTADLIRQLEAKESGAAPAPNTADMAAAPPKIAFLFSGPGSEYPGMGRGLYLSEPEFRKHLDVCMQILDQIGSSGSIRWLLSKSGQSPTPTPGAAALFCFQFALTRLWQSWGISPAVVMGHSLGEYAAACTAGVFSLENALRLITSLDRSAAVLPSGVMVSVLAAPDKVLPWLKQEDGRVVIAACNSPRNTLIAGPEDSVNRVCIAMNRHEIQTIRISTATAYHSPLMEPVAVDWKHTAENIVYAVPRIPVISTLTGNLENERMAAFSYWMDHIRGKVCFSDGLRTLNSMGDFVFLEIGPQPTLLSLAKQNSPAVETHWLPSLRQGMEGRQQMLTSLGQLYEIGVNIRWEAVDSGLSCKRVTLPAYPFQRRRYWFDASPPPACNGMPQVMPITSGHPGLDPVSDAAPLPPPPCGQMRRQWPTIPEPDRRSFLVAYLHAQTARVMGMIPDSACLDPNQGFFSLGLDSIMAVDLRQWIVQDMDIDLPMTVLFDFPNMTKLAVYIEEMLMKADIGSDASFMTPHETPQQEYSDAVSELSSEIADRLNKELYELENLLRS